MADRIVKDTGPLTWNIPIVTASGRPTPEFQRRWETQRNNNALIGFITFGDGAPPLVPAPEDGAEYLDISDTPAVLYIGKDGAWVKSGVRNLIELADVPSSYSGAANDLVRVKSTEDQVEFVSLSAVLDTSLTNTQGSIIYRGASGWTTLAPGTSGNYLKTNGAGADPSWAAITATGTVTSVGLSMPAMFTVSGSPVTTSGTLTATLANQSANQIFAGPSTGAAAAPTFRALVAADLPNTAVTPGTYGDSTHVGAFTVDQQGRITSASNVAVSGGGGGSGGSGGALTLITEVVTSGSASNVTFSSIPTIYRDLIIVLKGRGTTAAAGVDINFQLNGDTGSNYLRQFLSVQNTTVSGGGGTALGNSSIGAIAAASATANYIGSSETTIFDYNDTTFFKKITSHSGYAGSNTSASKNYQDNDTLYLSTSAITSVKLYPSAGNFVDGTVVSLYGRGGSAGAGLIKINEVITTGSQSTITFSSGLDSGRHLLLNFQGRGSVAANSAQLRMRFNSDTSAVYDMEEFHYYSSGVGATQEVGQTSLYLSQFAGTSATANRSGSSVTHIFNHRGTTFDKGVVTNWVNNFSTGTFSQGSGQYTGTWRPASPAAITRIDLFCNSGNFVDGSIASLYYYG